MKRIIFRALFWVLWPAIFTYAPLKVRARIALLDARGSILLVKPFFGNGAWQLPGGGIKRGETPLDAALRELFEETGIRLQHAEQLCLRSTYIEAGLCMRYELFYVQVATQPLATLNSELAEAVWVNPKKPGTLTLSNHAKAAMNLTGVAQV